MGDLGSYNSTGVLSPQNKVRANCWVVTFTPENMPAESRSEVWHGAVTGPGGYFLVYLGGVFYDVGQNGRLNAYDPNIPMLVKKGQEIQLHWSISTAPAPVCTLYFRQPEVGIF